MTQLTTFSGPGPGFLTYLLTWSVPLQNYVIESNLNSRTIPKYLYFPLLHVFPLLSWAYSDIFHSPLAPNPILTQQPSLSVDNFSFFSEKRRTFPNELSQLPFLTFQKLYLSIHCFFFNFSQRKKVCHFSWLSSTRLLTIPVFCHLPDGIVLVF